MWQKKDSDGVPLFLTSLIKYITVTALDKKDLFTQAPKKEVRERIDQGDLDFDLNDPHEVAGLLTQYLHELPNDLLPRDQYSCFMGIFKIQSPDNIKYMLSHYTMILPSVNKKILFLLFEFLEKACKTIDEDHLAKVFGRIILRPTKETSEEEFIFVTKYLFNHYNVFQLHNNPLEMKKMVSVSSSNPPRYIKKYNLNLDRHSSPNSNQKFSVSSPTPVTEYKGEKIKDNLTENNGEKTKDNITENKGEKRKENITEKKGEKNKDNITEKKPKDKSTENKPKDKSTENKPKDKSTENKPKDKSTENKPKDKLKTSEKKKDKFKKKRRSSLSIKKNKTSSTPSTY